MKRVSILAAAGALGCLAIVPVASQAATSATSATSATARTAVTSASAAYHGTFGHGSRIAAAATGVAGLKPVAPSASIENVQSPRVLARFRSPGGPNAAARATGAGAAKVSAAGIVSAGKATSSASGSAASSASGSAAAKAGLLGPRVRHAFDGLNDLINDRLYGVLTPPDQGLCVGPDHTIEGVPDAVWEVVNEVGIETTRSGAVLTPAVALPTLFQDPYSFSDPRCLFDPATQSFYFTQIGFPVATGPSSTLDNTVNDVLVVNSRGAAAYQFDSSLGGNCLGDQPKTGFTNNALIISTDEYCGPTQSDYRGAIVQVISKPELVAEAATVTDAVIGPVSLAGNPVVGLDPAINAGTRTGYLVNSVPYRKDGSNNLLGRTLGLWTLANSASVTTGKGTPVLTGKVLPSEPYAFPVPAPSTGDGSTRVYKKLVITSETVLNPDDSRLSGPVNVTPAPDGGVYLWTALATAVAPTGTATQDGAAWFKISTARQKVVGQGYVAARGASLLYPAVYAAPYGPVTMVYTITSRTINPSAAFSVLGRPGIQIVGAGSGPHWSFADAPPYNSFRWGDYSFAVPDPVTGGIWMATEYIPRKAEWDGYDNWGTFVFEVGGLA